MNELNPWQLSNIFGNIMSDEKINFIWCFDRYLKMFHIKISLAKMFPVPGNKLWMGVLHIKQLLDITTPALLA